MLEGKYKMKKLLFMAAAAIAVSCGNKQQAIQAEGDSTNVATLAVVAAMLRRRMPRQLRESRSSIRTMYSEIRRQRMK